MPTTIPPTEPTALSPHTHLDLVHDELMQLHPSELASVNVDAAAAAAMVIGCLPHILKHRAALAELCGERMASSVDRLELLALTMLEAIAKEAARSQGIDIPELAQEVCEIRAVLLADVRALIHRKVVPASAIGELRGARGYKNLCVDVMTLVSLLRQDWEEIEPQTGLELRDLHRAEARSNALLTAVGVREQAGPSSETELRQRAYTLLWRTYDDVRRMITFLRWREGDADEIAPSFFRGRGNGRRRAARNPTSSEGGGSPVTTG